MGKTAMVLALIVSEPIDKFVGPNLIVLPPHLMLQWESEAKKFVKDGEVNIIVGTENYRHLLKELDDVDNKIASGDDMACVNNESTMRKGPSHQL